jgi:hypothetical protein
VADRASLVLAKDGHLGGQISTNKQMDVQKDERSDRLKDIQIVSQTERHLDR